MNIQIFGKSKCFDTKKAERWFKERRIRFQSIDLGKYGHQPRGAEKRAERRGAGGPRRPQAPRTPPCWPIWLRRRQGGKAAGQPQAAETPIVRNGRQATVGYCPEVWQGWA